MRLCRSIAPGGPAVDSRPMEFRVIAVPGYGAEDVVVAPDGSVFTGTEDGVIHRIAPDGEVTPVADTGGRPAGPGTAPRRPAAGLRRPPRPAGGRPVRRRDRRAGRRPALLQQRRGGPGRHRLLLGFVHRPPDRGVEGGDGRGDPHRPPAPPHPGRRRHRAARRPGLRQRGGAARRRVVRRGGRDRRPHDRPALALRPRRLPGRGPARLSGQHRPGQRRPDLGLAGQPEGPGGGTGAARPAVDPPPGHPDPGPAAAGPETHGPGPGVRRQRPPDPRPDRRPHPVPHGHRSPRTPRPRSGWAACTNRRSRC